MENDLITTKLPNNSTTTIPKFEPKLGQWYWIAETCRWDGEFQKNLKKGDTYEWFGCIMKIGSNFVELHSPHTNHGGYNETRIHFDNFHAKLRLEKDPESVIKDQILYWQTESRKLLNDVRDLTARLGLNPKNFIESSQVQQEGSTALMVVSGTENINIYKQDLILANRFVAMIFTRVK